MGRSALKLEISRQSCRLSDMKTRKAFFRKKRQEFFLSFFDVVGNCSRNKTDLRIEYAGDEEERHIIYSSFLQLHKEESTIPRQLLAGGPPFLSRKEPLDRLAYICSKDGCRTER